MDWLQFLSSLAASLSTLLASLAWPITIIVLVLLLKNNVSALFPFIESLKYKDVEIQFRKSLQEVTEKSRAALPQPDTETTSLLRDRLYSLAEISPRSAILEAWLQVETIGAEALQHKDPSFASKSAMAPLRLGQALNQQQIINGAQLEIFNRLRDLRNKAVHIAEAVFTTEEVTEYIALASSLAQQIRRGSYGP